MSEENVEIVRRVHEGWGRGDFGVGADLVAQDFEWHQFPQAVEPGTRRGAEVGEALRKMFEVYENLRVEAREFIDAGDKVVVIGSRARDGQRDWAGPGHGGSHGLDRAGGQAGSQRGLHGSE
jgi:ketosteroid isomerase-like protein